MNNANHSTIFSAMKQLQTTNICSYVSTTTQAPPPPCHCLILCCDSSIFHCTTTPTPALFDQHKTISPINGIIMSATSSRRTICRPSYGTAHHVLRPCHQFPAHDTHPVGTQDKGYVRNVPLPRVPLRQSPRCLVTLNTPKTPIRH